MAVEQHPVLEGAGFAFVGVANHTALAVGRVGFGTGAPLARGRETGTAAAAQTGAFNLGQQLGGFAGQHGGQRRCLGGQALQQHVGAPDVVLHRKPVGRPALGRHAGQQPLGQLVDARRVQPRDHLVVVDQQGRSLVAQAGAGTAVHTEAALRIDLAGGNAQAFAKPLHQRVAARHAVRDVV
ncbi:hypothetical protein D9M69_587740 [compost metagenome]